MPPDTLPTDYAPEAPAPSRLESFSDGVIAVIITIMVLEFKLPQEPGPKAFIAHIVPTSLFTFLCSVAAGGRWWSALRVLYLASHSSLLGAKLSSRFAFAFEAPRNWVA